MNHGATELIIINQEMQEISKEQISGSKRSRLYLTKEKSPGIPAITITETTAKKIIGNDEFEKLIKKNESRQIIKTIFN